MTQSDAIGSSVLGEIRPIFAECWVATSTSKGSDYSPDPHWTSVIETRVGTCVVRCCRCECYAKHAGRLCRSPTLPCLSTSIHHTAPANHEIHGPNHTKGGDKVSPYPYHLPRRNLCQSAASVAQINLHPPPPIISGGGLNREWTRTHATRIRATWVAPTIRAIRDFRGSILRFLSFPCRAGTPATAAGLSDPGRSISPCDDGFTYSTVLGHATDSGAIRQSPRGGIPSTLERELQF